MDLVKIDGRLCLHLMFYFIHRHDLFLINKLKAAISMLFEHGYAAAWVFVDALCSYFRTIVMLSLLEREFRKKKL